MTTDDLRAILAAIGEGCDNPEDLRAYDAIGPALDVVDAARIANMKAAGWTANLTDIQSTLGPALAAFDAALSDE